MDRDEFHRRADALARRVEKRIEVGREFLDSLGEDAEPSKHTKELRRVWR